MGTLTKNLKSIKNVSLAIACGVILATGMINPASAAAETRTAHAQLHSSTKYLCQKQYNGHWCTVYVCYCYADACTWYNNQPNNARIIAQK